MSAHGEHGDRHTEAECERTRLESGYNESEQTARELQRQAASVVTAVATSNMNLIISYHAFSGAPPISVPNCGPCPRGHLQQTVPLTGPSPPQHVRLQTVRWPSRKGDLS